MSNIDNILKGSIDMHIHAGPDPRVERRLDALQLAQKAQESGMRAIVLKSHDYPTAPLAFIINQLVPGVRTLGSLSLDFEVGGLNPDAVEASARMGAKVVWMPTLSSANDMKKRGLKEHGISILDEKGNLLSVIHNIIEIIKQYGMVLATGHVSAEESFALVEAARKAGIFKIVVTHPLLEKLGAHLNLEQQQRMVEMGAFIEHCFAHSFHLDGFHPDKIAESVKTVGAEHCILSTDLGQSYNPTPAEGMRWGIATMRACHLTEEEVVLLVKTNPARLLDLD
jgi:hypothetical protein